MNYVKILGSVSPYCKNSCNCPGYMVVRNKKKILLDCGSGITRQMNFPEDLENLTIIISHYHKDHYSDLFSIGYASLCYLRDGLLKSKIKVLIPEIKPGEIGYHDYQLIRELKEAYFEIQTYNENDLINLDDNIISFYKVNHSILSYSCKINNNAFTLVYTGDMGYKNIDKYISFCKNTDILISESTYLEKDNKKDENHLHTKEAAQIANLSNVKVLVLTHFWPENKKNDYLKEAQSIFTNTIVAEEGVIIDIDDSKVLD